MPLLAASENESPPEEIIMSFNEKINLLNFLLITLGSLNNGSPK